VLGLGLRLGLAKEITFRHALCTSTLPYTIKNMVWEFATAVPRITDFYTAIINSDGQNLTKYS